MCSKKAVTHQSQGDLVLQGVQSKALSTWRQKRLFLYEQLARESDASAKFNIRQQIQECEEIIQRLEEE